MTQRSRRVALALAALWGLVVALAGLVVASPALAHPHIFVEARSRLVVDETGKVTAVRQVFRFDDAYTAFAIQGFDADNDGRYSREELAELAKVNVESMEEFGFFTFGDNSRVELDFTLPQTYWLEVVDVPLADYWAMKPEDIEAIRQDSVRLGRPMPETAQLLELHFLLPLKEPTDLSAPVTLDVYDPTYYVDFRFSRVDGAIGIDGAPDTCRVERRDPPSLDAATAAALAAIGPDQRDLPPELEEAAAQLVNQMIVTCGEAASVAATPPFPDVTPLNRDRAAAAEEAANVDAGAPDVAAVGVEPVAPPAPPAAGAGSLVSTFFGHVALLQTEFYQKLIAALRAFRTNPEAAWLLAGISFLYGVFHAVGPGHGKAIISSYVLASGDTLRKGVMLSFVSAFAQALTAILLVGGAAWIFNLTSLALQETARTFETLSFALVTGLGVWLVWVKAIRPYLPGRAAIPHGAPGHVHVAGDEAGCDACGHVHAPTPAMLAEPLTPARALSIILAIGLRPCSGALIVLVFALSQGMVLAGVASTLAMSLGTGITVALLAFIAVGAKGLAARLAGSEGVWPDRIHRGIEIAAAVTVFVVGATLLIANLGWA
ncbi:HoxN/HupN/NixA family nickel/cobalt transporter [Pannonibacter tanglangensis]|uniref:DUF1007 family protein n=1 Tax=Pannonibacter tanglangensis TaxID=2750084 RepID=A0ABW9ZKE6_9HYPH|nr:DUF1007 family protein [Pannonibacter sp. XCT-34]NBN65345.1 DUF1007 family protein [Pannonibacter sp. XCT-34]